MASPRWFLPANDYDGETSSTLPYVLLTSRAAPERIRRASRWRGELRRVATPSRLMRNYRARLPPPDRGAVHTPAKPAASPSIAARDAAKPSRPAVPQNPHQPLP